MIHLLFAAVGLFFVGLAVPLRLRRVGPNHIYGLRVKETLADETTWYEANARSALDLLFVGVALFGAALATWGFDIDHGSTAILLTVVLVAGTLWMCIRGLRIARAIARSSGDVPDDSQTGK